MRDGCHGAAFALLSPNVRIAFVIDAPASLKGSKDSSVEIMRAAAAAADEVIMVLRSGLDLGNDGLRICGRRIGLRASDELWFEDRGEFVARGSRIDLIFMRLEPPINDDFRHCCNLLGHAERAGIAVVNRPAALVSLEEKITPLAYGDLCPATLISADQDQLLSFANSLSNGCILKPLGGMGGEGIFAFAPGDSNLATALAVLGGNGRSLVVQERLAGIAEGDRRVFVIDGQPAPMMLNRLPRAGSHLGNMAAGGRPVATALGAAERRIAERVGPDLRAAGIVFAGLDVIGGKLTEINISCPTGLRQVRDQSDVDLASEVLAAAKLMATTR